MVANSLKGQADLLNIRKENTGMSQIKFLSCFSLGFILCVRVCACMQVCALSGARGSEKMLSGLLELELQIGVNHHVDSGN